VTVPGPFTYEGLPLRVVFGLGARRRLPDELDPLGLTQVVLIASASSRAEADALAGLLDHRLTWRVDGVGRHVPSALADQVCADARRVGEVVADLTVRHMDDLPAIALEEKIAIGIVALLVLLAAIRPVTPNRRR